MSIVEFVAVLQQRLSIMFPVAEVIFDGDGLTVYYKHTDGDGDFVHLLTDLTCMEEEESGRVAVHARPDHIFLPAIVVETDESRTITLENQAPFVDGDWMHEHGDGHGNHMWVFNFPEDGHRIEELMCGLTGMAARYFEGIMSHSSSLNRNMGFV